MVWIVWFALCIWVGVAANNKGRSGIGWFILAFLLSPLLAGVVLACNKDLRVDEDVNKVKMEHQHLKDRVVLNEKITEHRLNRVEADVNKLGNGQNNNSNANYIQQTKLLESGNKLCPACAETIKEAAIKCKHCGIMLNEIMIMDCPYCKETISADVAKCKHCNSDLTGTNNNNYNKNLGY